MTVGFTVKDEQFYIENGYTKDSLVSETGPVGFAYYHKSGLIIDDPIHVNYVEYPWIACFEVEGIIIDNDFPL